MKSLGTDDGKVIYALNYNDGKNIKYSLYKSNKSNKNFYGISVTSIYNGRNITETVANISEDKKFVKKLIKYLIQNGVDDICLKDVIEDLNFRT